MRNLIGSICILLGSTNVVSSDELITAGILTCTPVQQNEKPIVFLFNEENLVRDDKKYWLLDKMGIIQSRYHIFAGLTPSKDFISKVSAHQAYLDWLKKTENANEAVNEYIWRFAGWCENSNTNGALSQIEFRHSQELKGKINIPYLDELDCQAFGVAQEGNVRISMIDKVIASYLNAESNFNLPAVTEEDYYLSKVTIDTLHWSIIIETFFKGQLSYEEEDEFQNITANFASTQTKCQVIQLDKVEIDQNERIIELPGEKL